ncbi:MAG: Fe-S cluster assembly ATPase SufC [Patescibacteria group bacterium]
MDILILKNLSVSVGDRIILNNINLKIKSGSTCVIMGPNGSGKSTLANILMGHPAYRIDSGQIIFKGVDITEKKPEERAALGIFLAWQQPREIAGLDFYPFLFDAYKSLEKARGQKTSDVFVFKKRLDEEITKLKITGDWSKRYLNQGFSGGEKKKSEMLQLALFKPSLAIFDEIDSGLDVDALQVVGRALKRFKHKNTSALVVTHYVRILQYLSADKVIVMSKGRIIKSGGPALARQLEKKGFSNISD